MNITSQPLVSIVTPVYNGEKYLAECIESVLDQTYGNWEYVIVNNCSTDRTLQIARKYEEQDKRIRIHQNADFLDLIPNWNHSLRQISHDSKYCKVVHSDDCLFPECVQRMVHLAEMNPTVGIVGCYVLKGTSVKCCGLPYASTVVSGREICRSRLLGGPYLFGSPTSLLIRSDLIRSSKAFYNETYFHADIEACFNVLQSADFGFVHQVLTYTRLHDETQTSTFAERYASNIIENFRMTLEYGPIYLSEEQYQNILHDKLDKYYRFLAVSRLKSRKQEFWDYHEKALEKMGCRLSNARLIITFLSHVFDKSVGRILRLLKKPNGT